MNGKAKSETETVIKRILPYLSRRGYDVQTDLHFEEQSPLNTRYAKGYVDILVTCGKSKPRFLIEAKRAAKKLTQKDREQAIEYGTGLKVPFVVVTNGTDVQCFNTANGKAIRWNGRLTQKIPTRQQLGQVISTLAANNTAVDIPLSNDASLPFRPGLPLKQLNELFKRCHNTIRKIEKDEEHAFADFSKLLFLKLLEEKSDLEEFGLAYSYRFHEMAERPESESDQVKDAILRMLSEIRDNTPYGDVLEDDVYLKNPKTFRYIVRQLASVSFYDSSLDSKGAAFEYFVRATLKGRRLGQYFTPRPLVVFMSHLVGDEKIVNSLVSGANVKVLDPACGSGGFLVYLMQRALALLVRLHAQGKITGKARNEVAERIKLQTFYGSDANPGIAAAAKMNMIIAGDGHTNIRSEDSLANSAVNWSLSNDDCDLILTNPPFGTSEAESLHPNDLSSYPIRTAKGQLLFLQKMVMSTVAGGEICSVIDEGVLNTASAATLRKWLFEKCEVLGVIRLPAETFKPNRINVRSSVVYLRRREQDDVDLEEDYDVTLCDLQSLGYTGSGETMRGFDFQRLMLETERSILDHNQGRQREGYWWQAFDVRAQEMLADHTCRLDYKYWVPAMRERIAELSVCPNTKIVKSLNLIETRRGVSPPESTYVDERDGYALVVKAGSNISKFGELVEGGDYIEKNVFDEYEEYHLVDGDVLLASTGDGTLGKCCVFRSDKPAIADGHVTVIRVSPSTVVPEYLCDYLRCGFGAPQIERLYTGSTGLIELTPDDVDAIIVEIPPSVDAQRATSLRLRGHEETYRQMMGEAETNLTVARKEFTETQIS